MTRTSGVLRRPRRKPLPNMMRIFPVPSRPARPLIHTQSIYAKPDEETTEEDLMAWRQLHLAGKDANLRRWRDMYYNVFSEFKILVDLIFEYLEIAEVLPKDHKPSHQYTLTELVDLLRNLHPRRRRDPVEQYEEDAYA